MKNKKVLSSFIVMLLVFGIFFTGGITVFAADPVNLFNADSEIQQSTTAEFDGKVFSMTSNQGEYLASFSVPKLTKTYTWSGDVTVTDIDESVPYSGVRFCIGFDEASGNYINLIVTRNIGVSADQRGAVPKSELYPVSTATYSDSLTDGKQFHFEIIRDSAHIIMKIDNKVVMDFTLSNEYNLFTEGNDFNLGFYACMCAFDVKNIAVYDPDVAVPTVNATTGATSGASATANSSATNGPAASNKATSTQSASSSAAVKNSTPKPTTSSVGEKEDKDGISPVIIIAVVAAVILIGVTTFIVIKKRKAGK